MIAGTFSSVYKAIDLKHTQYDNSLWVPSARLSPPPARYTSYKPPKKIYVALKRIYVTSSPARIENEISILEDLRCVYDRPNSPDLEQRADKDPLVCFPNFPNLQRLPKYLSDHHRLPV